MAWRYRFRYKVKKLRAGYNVDKEEREQEKVVSYIAGGKLEHGPISAKSAEANLSYGV